MTDTELLKDAIRKSGLKMQFVAEQLDLSYQGLNNKINNRSEFKTSEIQKLCNLLFLGVEDREQIFFANRVD